MRADIEKIALGGGCHWCTEAVFQSLLGVENVKQGYVASVAENQSFSEAVIVYFNPKIIPIKVLIEIHLYTHKSTVNHSMRYKYRSAIYAFSDVQKVEVKNILKALQLTFSPNVLTEILAFSEFRASREQIQNYYFKNPKKPFCETFINPKLKLLLKQFTVYTNPAKLKHLQYEEHKIKYRK